MVGPRRRGNCLLHLLGLSANARLLRTRACGYSGSNPAIALRRSPFFSSPPVTMLRSHHKPVSYVRHSIARPFLSPTYESLYCASFIYFTSFLCHSDCLSCASFIYLFPMFVILLIVLARPLLSPTCESLYCASFVCLTRLSVLW
jgi:hypothetical protein